MEPLTQVQTEMPGISLKSARRIVVKIGSALLVDRSGALRLQWLESLAQDVARLKARGADVVLVSSGSIALGRALLGLDAGALPLEQSQAAASVGQIRLAGAYETALAPHGITTGQVLVTLEDSADRRRYLNSRATLATLLGLGVVPIVNENDTIATDEIRYGDNDRLAAQVAATVEADLLVLLSDVDGLYTANPNTDPDARHLPVIDEITPEIEEMAGEAASILSRGGMRTKVMAAKTATASGCAMIIGLGAGRNPLKALEDGVKSSLFTPQTDPHTARKSWIAAMKPQGGLVVDAGAARALGRGNSLLPVGLVRVDGDFGRGEPVEILDGEGHVLAQGLSRYTSDEALRLVGQRSDQIEAILGYPGRAVLVHRDDMAL